MIFSFSTHVMAKKLLNPLWVFLIFLNPVLSQNNPNFIYDGFTPTTTTTPNISLNGIAEIQTDGIIKLTNDTRRLLGHAFYPYLIQFKNSTNGSAVSFSTSFTFAIVPEYPKLGGHGLAFAMASSKDLPGALPSQYLGLLNSSDNGNLSNHVFAVEFDTVQDFEFNDIDDNHIGININSMTSNASVTAAYYTNGNSTKQDVNLKSGSKIFAWIDYDSTKNQITVSISPLNSKPSFPILSFDVDLSPILFDYMYVGFSASTGLLASSHYVFGWSFAINGKSKLLSSLPSLPGPKKSHATLIISVSVSVAVVVALAAIIVSIYMIRKIKNADIIEAWELDVGPHRFSYPELKKATRGFRDKELLGFGGFGRVYKGTLPNSNTQIAVKQISHESKQGLREFASEITSIGRLRHRNLVQLLGWCRRRGDLLLVYDFMPNGSLDKYLFDEPNAILSWEQRFHIIKGVAQGLLYLHEGWEQTVIHRDIKAGNVLVDSELNGRVGDFGLAKLYEHGSNPSTTRVVGTLGYLAPELTRTGKPTTSSDVFAFGALLLEVVCARRPVEPKASPEELILVDWVWERWQNGSILTVVDGRLRGEYDESEVVVVVKLGLMCSANVAAARPTMRQVVRYLDGETRLPEILVPPDSGGGNRGSGGVEFEDFVYSFRTSFNEKVSAWSADGDVEGRSGSSFSLSGGGGGR